MDENLTKRGAAREPVHAYPARGDHDERVHLADAAPVDVVDPANARTRCGERVLEIYNDDTRDVTCPECAATRS